MNEINKDLLKSAFSVFCGVFLQGDVEDAKFERIDALIGALNKELDSL